jgi:hypothetical protein
MKTLLVVFMTLFICGAHSGEETLRTFVTISRMGDHLKVTRASGEELPVVFGSREVRQKFANLPKEASGMIEGRIHYESLAGSEGQRTMKPFFIVESITPIDLRDLQIATELAPESKLTFHNATSGAPYALPITTDVASAITLTSSVLLLESLASGPNEPTGRREIRKAMLLSTGILATLILLHDQIKGIKKP